MTTQKSSRDDPASGHPSASSGSGNLNITESDRGKTFLLLAGDTITLTLPENPSTGYRWVLSLPEGVDQLRTIIRPPKPRWDPQVCTYGSSVSQSQASVPSQGFTGGHGNRFQEKRDSLTSHFRPDPQKPADNFAIIRTKVLRVMKISPAIHPATLDWFKKRTLHPPGRSPVGG